MKRRSLFLLLVIAALLAWFAQSQTLWAAERTVQLRTPGNLREGTLQVIGIIVSQMPGVISVDADPIAQTTTVTFDDSKVKVEDIIRQIRNNGYQVLGEPKYIK
jgi:hypothetical protein